MLDFNESPLRSRFALLGIDPTLVINGLYKHKPKHDIFSRKI